MRNMYMSLIVVAALFIPSLTFSEEADTKDKIIYLSPEEAKEISSDINELYGNKTKSLSESPSDGLSKQPLIINITSAGGGHSTCLCSGDTGPSLRCGRGCPRGCTFQSWNPAEHQSCQGSGDGKSCPKNTSFCGKATTPSIKWTKGVGNPCPKECPTRGKQVGEKIGWFGTKHTFNCCK